MERVARIELAALAWKAKVLPLYDTRASKGRCYYATELEKENRFFLKTGLFA